MRIKIFSSFCGENHAKKSMEALITPYLNINYGDFKKGRDPVDSDFIYIVPEGDNTYTHVVIWNTAMPSIPSHIPKKNVIGLSFEPIVYLGLSPQFIEYASRYIETYYIGDAKGLPKPFEEGNAYLPYNPPRPTIPLKSSVMSLVISNKKALFGHKYRHQLLKYILHHGFPIDVFGLGVKKQRYEHFMSETIKGPFERYEPYDNYLFSIAIENTDSNHYFGEKVINPLIAGCTPIYWGCRNIDKYFPEKTIKLVGDIRTDMSLLLKILQSPWDYYKKINTVEIQKKVSFLNNLDNIFKVENKEKLKEEIPPEISICKKKGVRFPDDPVEGSETYYYSESESESELDTQEEWEEDEDANFRDIGSFDSTSEEGCQFQTVDSSSSLNEMINEQT